LRRRRPSFPRRSKTWRSGNHGAPCDRHRSPHVGVRTGRGDHGSQGEGRTLGTSAQKTNMITKNITNLLARGTSPEGEILLLIHNDVQRTKTGKDALTAADKEALENWHAKTNEEVHEWNRLNEDGNSPVAWKSRRNSTSRTRRWHISRSCPSS